MKASTSRILSSLVFFLLSFLLNLLIFSRDFFLAVDAPEKKVILLLGFRQTFFRTSTVIIARFHVVIFSRLRFSLHDVALT